MIKAAPDLASHERPYQPEHDTALERGLEIARRTTGVTFVALPAPEVAAPALIAAFRAGPAVAWASRDLTIVGLGAAHELRGRGDARWHELIAAARAIEAGPIVGGDALGDASWLRPRLVGGLAFAPGSADRAPWTGFGDAWFVLPRWTYVHAGARRALLLAVDAHDAKQVARWRDELAALRLAAAAPFTARPQPMMTRLDRGDVDAWRAEVRAITDAIVRGEYAKIVAARSAVVTLAGEARAADLFAELDARQADCVRVLVRPPAGGTLIAATPERLVRLDERIVACDALAGSVARSGRADEDARARDALLASAKDRREHELVVAAIASALRGLGADVEAPAEPGLRTLRHVHHLHTPLAARLPARRHVLELAAALHPTPAVGGTPTRVASEWIASHEVSRGWYAAPVGWFDLDGNGEIAVAIRSGVLAGEHAHLWAGAGIVAGSDPDRELAETDLKLRAMLGALGVPA